MKNIVISLVSEQQRREHIIAEFSKQDVKFEFFDAITPKTSADIAKEININIENTNLGAGEVSCLLSHVVLWKKMLDENLDHIAIFEDDIYLGENVRDFLNDNQWIPEYCDIIKLEAFSSTIKSTIKPTEILQKNRKLFPLRSSHVGAAGYILSKKAAVSLLEYFRQTENLIAVDKAMFNYYLVDGNLPVFQMLPALCVQEHRMAGKTDLFPSTLKHERSVRREIDLKKNPTKQKTILQTMYKELSRPFIQLISIPWIIYSKLATKKVEFR
ncbi:glycosyltransferase family 25 protein [Acinetobacter sp. 2JN-4]|uniref:glycosyltransferase family 25 protein n=1 Tax=Acinetobacter sp. 2JN-4 TaxID=2479844 RepID=UPI000EF9C138|nr:glycosyltransferase family 25 protein [Acinetobacter sp. 2JN-4]RLZ11318.1 glycosyltransferase family 25 protein [Acinetobacter sp. 2JN-4]